MSVTNKGPSQATNVTVTDTLPGGITFVAAAGDGWNCSEVAKTVTCTRGSLDAAETSPDVTISVAVDFSTSGELENTASVSASEKDDKQVDNSQTISTTVVISPLYFAQFGDGEIASMGVAEALGASTIQLSSEIFLLNTDKTMEAGATIAIKGDDGQPLTATFADYCMPTAEDMPTLTAQTMETPSPINPLGVKGGGELPTVAAPAAVANALVDALSSAGVEHLDAPLTPERVWQALQESCR